MFAMVSIAMVTITSCSKQKEDPAITLPSKKNLIVNTWAIEKYFENGEDMTDQILPFLGNYSLEFRKDGTFNELIDGDGESGKWKMDSKEENLEMLYDGTTDSDTLKILRLAGKEMWLMQDDGVTKIEVHFKPK